MKSFSVAIKTLNKALKEKEPKVFSSSWICKNSQPAYNYFRLNCKTENGDIDWDLVTQGLHRSFQKRWMRYKRKNIKSYERQSEVDVILEKYKDKLYTFLAPADDRDKKLQHRMIISLVRIGQKGNVCAQEELIKWVTFITNDWIDRYPQMYRWKGYTDEVPDKIRGCIRLYRYTGSFLGYLFKTLEYSALGKPPLVSVDDRVLDGKKARIEYLRVEQDEMTNETTF
jgi:hypothetical protein